MSYVKEHPQIRELDEQGEQIEKVRRAASARSEQRWAVYWASMASWREEADAAIDACREPPAPPEEPLPNPAEDEATTRAMSQRQQLAKKRQRVMAEIAPEITEAVYTAEAELLTEADPVVEALLALVARWAGLANDLDAVSSERHTAPSLLDIVEAVTQGRSLLAPVLVVPGPSAVRRVVEVHMPEGGLISDRPHPFGKPPEPPSSGSGQGARL